MPEGLHHAFYGDGKENALYKQLESALSENSVETVLDMMANVIDEADEWVDPTFQTFATEQIRNAATQLRDEDWQRELDGEEATQ